MVITYMTLLTYPWYDICPLYIIYVVCEVVDVGGLALIGYQGMEPLVNDRTTFILISIKH